MLHGSPGIGKSSIVKSIAEQFNLKVIDLRLSQCDPTDLMGFPFINKEINRAEYTPLTTFPLEGDPLPKDEAGNDMEGWLLLLDEFPSAPLSVQAAAYKLVLDHEVGLHKLHPKVAKVCAGNKQTDNAIVNRMGTAMQSRLVHLELAIDFNQFLKWAYDTSMDFRITSYLNFKPEALHVFNPQSDDHTYPCPRTWEFVHKLISGWSNIDNAKRPLLAGTIGQGAAIEFMSYCSIYKDLPTIAQVVKAPLEIPISEEPSIMYAMSGSVANHIDKTNVDALVKYIDRLPPEFQIVTMQEIARKKQELLATPFIRNWMLKNAKSMF